MFHHALQRKYQADVAANQLFADFRHAAAGHNYYADAWKKTIDKQEMSRGKRAYAMQQHAVYLHNRNRFREQHSAARKPKVPMDEKYHDLVSGFILYLGCYC